MSVFLIVFIQEVKRPIDEKITLITNPLEREFMDKIVKMNISKFFKHKPLCNAQILTVVVFIYHIIRFSLITVEIIARIVYFTFVNESLENEIN
jgi:hypothetical protein